MLDAAVAIRAGSALLFVLLGLATLLISRREPGPIALACLLLTVGISNLATNLLDPRGDATIVTIAGLLAALVGPVGLVLAFIRPGQPSRARRVAGVVGVAVGIGTLVGTFANGSPLDVIARGLDEASMTTSLRYLTFAAMIGFAVGPTAFLVSASVEAALIPPKDRAGWVRASALVGLFAPYAIFYFPQNFPGDLWPPLALASTLLLVGSLTATWLIAAARSSQRFPVVVAVCIAALGLASVLYLGLPMHNSVETDAFGAYGILRVAGWAYLVYAIVRADYLGVPLPRIASKRGLGAASALAALFITAEVAQNFLSAEYGLLAGGIAAGALLFAANPIQRTMERLAERSVAIAPSPPSAKPGPMRDAHIAYKRAVRLALRDKHLGAHEELELARLAEDLGIGASTALLLRREAEQEIATERGTP